MILQRFYTSNHIEQHSRGYTHFFDRDSKRFFNSRIGSNAYPTANPFLTLFVTSEKCDWGEGHPRFYTVRIYDSRTRQVDTLGEFQEYNSSAAANRAARQLAPTIAPSVEELQEYGIAVNEEYDHSKRRAMARGDQGFAMYEIGAVNNWVRLSEEIG